MKEYATVDKKFPSNSTADQFMDDEQFAAYVTLGRWVADRTIVLLEAPSGEDDS